MFRTNRLQPRFDSLEGVVLLSTAVSAPSSSIRSDTAHGSSLEINGTLHGNKTVLTLDSGTALAADSQIITGALSFFDTSGRVSALGKVSGSFGPNQATGAALGALPDLSNLTLELANHAGSVQLKMAPSSTNRYQFKVAGGSGRYATAYGSGVLTITFREGLSEYLLELRSISG